MKILALQLAIAWEDRQANFTKVEAFLATGPPEPGTLVVLPEMFATGFSMSPNASEPEDGPHGQARRSESTPPGGTFPERL